MVKYLSRLGHDIRVITARDQSLDKSLPIDIDGKNIIYSDWLNLDISKKIIKSSVIDKIRKNKALGEGHEYLYLRRFFWNVYKSFFFIPDREIGWYPYAVREGRILLKKWPVDIIYASAMPYTSFLIAKKLSDEFNIPWIAEFRDLWSDNHYREFGPLRNYIDSKMENCVLKSSSGIVTVSEPMAKVLKNKHNKLCESITNGFDHEDYKPNDFLDDKKAIRIIYTGNIYPQKRDPSVLFCAINKLNELKKYIKVDFFGSSIDFVYDIADRFDCRDVVSVSSPVPYNDSLDLQKKADLLLLLLWNDKRENGVFTGKFFEYIGSGRPIIAIGSSENVASKVILEKKIGFVSLDPEEIAEILKKLVYHKISKKTLPGYDTNKLEVFSRKKNAEKLDNFIKKILS
jgi:hypothetical protein